MRLFNQSKRRCAHTPAKKNLFRPDLESLGERIVPAVKVWQGGNAAAWSLGGNWVGGQLPVNGDEVVIDNGTTSNMNIPNLQLAGISFGGGADVGLTLVNDLKINSAFNLDAVSATAPISTISGPGALVFVGNGTYGIVAANNKNLVINADVTGSGQFQLSGNTTGAVRLNGAFSPSGAAEVTDGLVAIGSTGETISLPFTIGDGGGGSASLGVIANKSVAFADLRAASDGGIGLSAGATLTAALLELTGATVSGPAGQLVVTDTLTTKASAATADISAPTKFSPGVTLNVGTGAAAVDLLFSDTISGSGSVRVEGGGTARIGGTDPTAHTGSWNVSGATLELAKPAGTQAIRSFSAGQSLDPSVIKLINPNQIADTANPLVTVLGTFDLNGQDETVNDLTVGAGGKVTTGAGDLTVLGAASLTAGDINMLGGGSLVLDGNTLIVSGAGNDNVVQILNGTIRGDGGEVNVSVNGAATTLEVTSVLANGTFVKDGAGHMTGIGNSANATPLRVADGKLTVTGLIPSANVTMTGGTLSGTGRVAAASALGGVIQPVVPDTPLRTSNLATTVNTTYRMTVFGQNLESQIDVTGVVNLGGATLDLIANQPVNVGSTHTLVINDGADAIQGTFANLPEGAFIAKNGQTFRITYKGGVGGNDVVLTRVSATNTTLQNPDAGDHIRVGATTTLTAVVGGAGPGGTVQFFDGATLVGSGQVGFLGVATANVALAEGMHSISAKYLGDSNSAPSASIAVNIEAVPELYAVGAGAGGAPLVTIYNADGSPRTSIQPFATNFAGGVRTATADVNGDGFPDIIAGTGPGVATQVRVFDGRTQAEIFSVAPFEAAFTGGVYVAAGDVNGDGYAEVVITPDEGGGPRVKVISGKDFSTMADFFGIDDAAFRGGARAALADMNGDGKVDLLVAAGFSGGPRVAGFDGAAIAQGDTTKKLFPDFFAFEQALRNGVFLTGGDFDGDGMAELAAGGGPGGAPRVTVFDGKQLLESGTPVAVSNFFAGDPNNRGGVRVGVKQLTSDSAVDLVTGSGTGGGSRVTAYDAETLLKGGTDPLHQFDAFPGFTGGVYVG